MEYLWKQNRPFILALAAWIVGALAWQGCILSPLHQEARRFRDERALAQQALEAAMKGGTATDEMLSRGEKELLRQQALLKSLRADLAAPEKAPFRVPDGKSAAEYFGNLQLERWNQLQETAQQAHVGLAQRESPFPKITTPGPETCRELLIRLALVDRICTAAIDAGVDRIETISPLEGAFDPGEATAQPGLFLNALPVKVKLRGSSESVFKVVHALQRKGEVYVLTSFWAVKAEEHADLFDCELEAAALMIAEKGAVAPPKEKS